MDMQIIEHHPQRVRDALRRGEFDAVEIVGEADEREFFELLFRGEASGGVGRHNALHTPQGGGTAMVHPGGTT